MPSTCVVCCLFRFVVCSRFFYLFLFCHTRFSHFVLNFPPLFYVTLLHLLHVLSLFIYLFLLFTIYFRMLFFLLHTKLLNFYLTLLCPKSRQKRWIRQKMGKKAGVRMRVWMGRLFTALRFTLHAHYTLPLAWCSVRAVFCLLRLEPTGRHERMLLPAALHYCRSLLHPCRCTSPLQLPIALCTRWCWCP